MDATTFQPLNLPPSPYYQIRSTPTSGRGVFATTSIPAHTLLHTATDLTAHLIYRDYRREVCLYCFAYDRGVSWPLRDSNTGLVFCAEDCRRAWFEEEEGKQGDVEVTVKAHEVVQGLLKRKARRDGDEDMVDVGDGVVAPGLAEVERAWNVAETEGRKIVNARTALEPTKSESKALKAALSNPTDSTVLPYLLSAVLVAHNSPERWKAVLELKATDTPYPSPEVLKQHTIAYHHLLATLPLPLLPSTTPTTLLSATNRDCHNSFGLRSLDDGGEEMFGFGVWASASYWNHNCSPNVEKERVGRTWRFWAKRDVLVGEELCISYLGLETPELGLEERRRRTRETWAFECECGRCVWERRGGVEAGDGVDQAMQ